MRVVVVRTGEVGLWCIAIEDDVDGFRHVGDGDAAVAVDVCVGDDEVAVMLPHDMFHYHGYVGHVDLSVAVHVPFSVDCALTENATSANVIRVNCFFILFGVWSYAISLQPGVSSS